MERKIIIAIDGSKYGDAAFSWYMTNLRRDSDEVHLIHIVTDDYDHLYQKNGGKEYDESAVLPDFEEEFLNGDCQECMKFMQSYKRRVEELSSKCFVHLRPSNRAPGSEICSLADGIKAECVVMGSRGLGTIKRTILGSVSDYVLHNTKAAVLICKTE